MKLNSFFKDAKINTYASKGEGGEKTYSDGCKELVYEDRNYKYKDRYYGFNPFIGEELVYKNEKVIWVMNYYGRILSDDIDGKELYNFLKKAMRQVKEDRPFRGPSEFAAGDYRYTDKSNGDIDNFTGIELIYYQGNKVYELYYHGGIIK